MPHRGFELTSSWSGVRRSHQIASWPLELVFISGGFYNISINQTAHNKNGRILFNFTQPLISWMVLWSDRVGKRLHTSYRSGTGGWGGQTRQQLASLAGPMIDRPSHLMKHLSLWVVMTHDNSQSGWISLILLPSVSVPLRFWQTPSPPQKVHFEAHC